VKTTAPCGVPTFVADHWLSSDTPAFSHFWIRRTMRGSANDAETTFTSVAARGFASPSCRQLKALSSRFSDAGCPATEGDQAIG
jgi:hypothetical protein